MADARRARRHKFVLLFFELEKIEVVTAIFLFFGARERFFGNAEKRKTRRKRERFLRAGEQDVDAERVHRDRDAEKEETVSTMSATSGYFASVQQISGNGFITPVEVSL